MAVKTAPKSGPEDHVDGCVCDIDIGDDATSDVDLPESKGGVMIAHERSMDIEDLDGCDLDFNEDDPTTDEELPVSTGGVA
jgi:hypothetical protein